MEIISGAVALGVAILIFQIGKWVNGMDRLKNEADSVFDRIEKELSKIRKALVYLLGPKAGAFFEYTSPLKLTDKGMQVAGEIDADKWSKQVVELLWEELKGQSKHQVQERCLDYVVLEWTEPAEANRILGEYAYNNGIGMESIKQIIAVLARDRILARQSAENLV
ncbi:MAG: hypothetical protein OXU79_02035 [Gemmatimonadota bacterium]|nr:hypothetical protein [Gemmatimonadota bacterium]